MGVSLMFDISEVCLRKNWPKAAVDFSEAFCKSSDFPKFVLGRNFYSKHVIKILDVDGVVDDFCAESSFEGLPIYRSFEVPQNSLILNAAGGRVLTSKMVLDKLSLQNLDYFAFKEISGLNLPEIRFNEGFREDFDVNANEYLWIYNLFKDSESREIFKKLVKFRYDHDISHLENFVTREHEQYFEDFLFLGEEDIFVDVGGYDGFTSVEFARRYPSYNSIHIFEPDPKNYVNCMKQLEGLKDIYFYPVGLGAKKQVLMFSADGESYSRLSESGGLAVNIERLDDILTVCPTFIKMDIEGAELLAIDGAREIISRCQPRLAISAYHAAGDFWAIPKKILSINPDYDISLRHYTESIYESVLFFYPKK
jgi:FkbM family methyltransferase